MKVRLMPEILTFTCLDYMRVVCHNYLLSEVEEHFVESVLVLKVVLDKGVDYQDREDIQVEQVGMLKEI